MVAAVAATLPPGLRIGVDTEKVRTPSQDLLDGAFSQEELAYFPPALGEEQQAEWIFRLWCAKEAVGKALGSGVPLDPRELAVVGADGGTVRLRFRSGASGELTALTFRRGDYVFAVAIASEAA
jgi:4'-phosphopantetheinyl transferase